MCLFSQEFSYIRTVYVIPRSLERKLLNMDVIREFHRTWRRTFRYTGRLYLNAMFFLYACSNSDHEISTWCNPSLEATICSVNRQITCHLWNLRPD